MICQQCRAEGERSTVVSHGTTSTLMYASSYWDEDGNYHIHDPNIRSAHYQCSRGHRWSVDVKPKCPTCDKEKVTSDNAT